MYNIFLNCFKIYFLNFMNEIFKIFIFNLFTKIKEEKKNIY